MTIALSGHPIFVSKIVGNVFCVHVLKLKTNVHFLKTGQDYQPSLSKAEALS